jgi:hypothetical protein
MSGGMMDGLNGLLGCLLALAVPGIIALVYAVFWLIRHVRVGVA